MGRGRRKVVRDQKTEISGLKKEVRGRKVRDRRSKLERLGDMQINSAKDLEVYKKAYSLAMEIYEISKAFP